MAEEREHYPLTAAEQRQIMDMVRMIKEMDESTAAAFAGALHRVAAGLPPADAEEARTTTEIRASIERDPETAPVLRQAATMFACLAESVHGLPEAPEERGRDDTDA